MTSITEVPSTDAIDAFTATMEARSSAPEPLLVTIGDGRVVGPARDREVLLAWGLDAVLVFAAAMGFYLYLSFTTAAPFPYARELAAVVGWPLAALIYGFTTSYHRSLGQLAAGTRTLRIDNGGSLGFWRAGWMMVLRVLILPAVFLFCLCGGSTFGIRDRHISIDALASGL